MGGKETILIVDDDPGLRKTLADILGAKGYAPLAAASGKAALQKLEKERPAVALLDLKMTDMDGIELMKEIKSISPGTECIVLTGYATQESAIGAVNLGAYGYQHKPYDMDQLLLAVGRAIEKQQAEQALRVSLQRWQSTFDAMSEGVSLIDVKGTIRQCNAAMSELLGKPHDEIIGSTCCKLVHGTSGPVADCPLVRMRESHRRETLELPVGARWFHVAVDPILSNGSLVGGVHVISDITERRRAEDEIKRVAEAWETTFNSTTSLISIQDRDYKVIRANPNISQKSGGITSNLLR